MGRDSQGNEIEGQQTITQARPGSSYHNYGMALDSCFLSIDPYWEYLQTKDPQEFQRRWAKFGEIATVYGLKWGGEFSKSDRPHVQISYGLSLADIHKLYEYGGIRSVWAKVDQIRGIRVQSEWGLPDDLPPAS